MRIAIYADGGPQIGYGHLVRTSALAKEYHSRGDEVRYVTATANAAKDIASEETRIVSIKGPEDFVSYIDSTDIDILVTDSYDIDHKIQRQLQSKVPRFGAIMDRNPHPICCDGLINGNLYAPSLEYEWTGTEPKWYLGTEYLILRKEIRKYIGKEPPLREKPKRAIITMGGGDQENITPTAVEAIKGFNLAVDVIVGPGFSKSQEQEVRSASENATAEIEVIRDPEDLPRRMFESDFAISTASTTTYELLALQTPIISVQVAENQELVIDALEERKLALTIEKPHNRKEYKRAIEQYLNNPDLWKNNRKRGKKLIDGEGVERITGLLSQLRK